jgi:hypothetical protein
MGASTSARGVGARRTRSGVCHRCGWRGSVTKVTRSDRRHMQIGRSFGRVCAECLELLLGADAGVGAVALPKMPKQNHRRDVA